MKAIIRIVAVLLSAAVYAGAADLYITEDGKSFWVTSAKREGSKVLYRTRKGGPVRSIAAAALEIVVPAVKKGAEYTPEQIDKALDRANRAIATHPNLRKQIQILKQQWQSLKSGDSDAVPNRIDELKRKFEASDKSPKVFQDIAFQVEMLSFKDAAGEHKEKIESALKKMQQEVFDVNLPKLKAMVGAGSQTLKNFKSAKKIAGQLKMTKLNEEQKEQLDRLVERCRKNTATECLRLAKTAFFAKKNVNGYLESMAILGDVEYSDVPTETDKKEIQKTRAIITASASRACRGYEFTEKGFPLDRQDRAVPRELKQRASSLPSGYAHGNPEHCFIMPTKSLDGKKTGDSISIPVRLIFNRDPIADTDYYLMGIFSVPGSTKEIVSEVLPIGQIKDGRLSAEFSAKVPRLEPKFQNDLQRRQWNNSTYFRLIVAYKGYRSSFSEHKAWVSASGECRYSFKR